MRLDVEVRRILAEHGLSLDLVGPGSSSSTACSPRSTSRSTQPLRGRTDCDARRALPTRSAPTKVTVTVLVRPKTVLSMSYAALPACRHDSWQHVVPE